MKLSITYCLYFFVAMMVLSSCLDFVEDGIEVNYEESSASFTVNPIGTTNSAANEVVSFEIIANSNADIKSLIVRANNEGKNGSGFNVSDSNFDDPFADHNFGTIQPNTQSFKVRYDYIVPEQINKSRITFTLIDEEGKKETQKEIEVVPSISYHSDITTYAKDATFNDAIAAAEGIVYQNVKDNYSTFTSENVEVQEKIDIIFYFNEGSKTAIIASPASNRIDLELSIENNTLFKQLDLPLDTDLSLMTAAELESITAAAELSAGSSDIRGVRVGQYIGFIADLNALNSLKKGILKIESMHPGTVPRYDGISYVLKCSILVQN